MYVCMYVCVNVYVCVCVTVCYGCIEWSKEVALYMGEERVGSRTHGGYLYDICIKKQTGERERATAKSQPVNQ